MRKVLFIAMLACVVSGSMVAGDRNYSQAITVDALTDPSPISLRQRIAEFAIRCQKQEEDLKDIKEALKEVNALLVPQKVYKPFEEKSGESATETKGSTQVTEEKRVPRKRSQSKAIADAYNNDEVGSAQMGVFIVTVAAITGLLVYNGLSYVSSLVSS